MVQDSGVTPSYATDGSPPPSLPVVPASAGTLSDGVDEDVDVLFHLGLRVPRSHGNGRCPPGTDDAVGLFGAVTHAVLCGSASRARALAAAFAGPAGEGLDDFTRTDRYALFRTAGGRVVVASHGIGRPSVSVVLNELTKLFRYARAGNSQVTKDAESSGEGVDCGTVNLPPVTYYRVGTCGGIGVPVGTLVLTSRVVDGQLRGEATSTVLGVRRSEPAVFDEHVVAALAAYAQTEDWGGGGKADGRAGAPEAGSRVVVGTTATLDGFYEEQGRMDGASCSFDDARRTAWLRSAYDAGVRNFEMEGLEFASFTHRHGIPAAMACVALINRLDGDQVTSPPAKIAACEADLIRLIVGFVRHRLEGEAAGATEARAS
ncbi:hypothetical protein MMPV_000338 [Pyropia vietnamensis]